jgi:RNA polymerase sigma-70 factor (ECF subfamily)
MHWILSRSFYLGLGDDRLNYDEAHLKSYLFQATRNRCLNYLKHQGIMRQYEKNAALQLRQIELVHYQSGEKSLIETESVDRINQAIESLSDVQKEVILLSRFDGLSNQEIADKLAFRSVRSKHASFGTSKTALKK